ncbi:hypothetical protein DERF_007352 [Dermatophagoides farinae]|uniref:Uncharacterized protein n=1 Tax=Dermatophagoides farinae TaxID=6954 RepID=A0A922I066_DERFA|nr:hypothetical protein DERF_007352 [Dermatophagoides farinae]
MELASLGLAIFQMMDRMVALALELELLMFQMMDRMAELDVVLVMELESLGFVMFQMMNRMFELVWEARDVLVDVLTVELVFVVMELPQDGLKIQLIERMAELDVVLVLAMFRMKMDQMAELVLELELSMFRMKMDRKVVLVLEMELSMFRMMDRMAELLGGNAMSK